MSEHQHRERTISQYRKTIADAKSYISTVVEMGKNPNLDTFAYRFNLSRRSAQRAFAFYNTSWRMLITKERNRRDRTARSNGRSARG